MLRQLCNDASDTVLIEKQRSRLKIGCHPILEWSHYYCLQTKFAEGYVFTGVCLCTGGVSAPLHAGTHPSWDQRQTPPWADIPLHSACWDMVNKRVVRIPLECILVFNVNSTTSVISELSQALSKKAFSGNAMLTTQSEFNTIMINRPHSCYFEWCGRDCSVFKRLHYQSAAAANFH